MRTVATGALLLLLVACPLGEDELPKVHVRSTPEPCVMPGPPLALVTTIGADPSHCLPVPVRTRGLNVVVGVSREGRATAVEDLLDLCLDIGKEYPKHRLSVREKECILEDLSDWRFAGVETCWPVFAHVSVGGTCETSTEPATKWRAVQQTTGLPRMSSRGGHEATVMHRGGDTLLLLHRAGRSR